MATGKSISPPPSQDNAAAAPKAQAGVRYRVGIAYPVEISGFDDEGKAFSHRTVTQFIMRDGVTLISKHRLVPGAKVHVKLSRQKTATGEVIGQTGIAKSGDVYAIAFQRDPAYLWGMHFPELSESDRLELTCVLGCNGCSNKCVVQLSAVEHELLVTNETVCRECDSCKENTNWRRVPDGMVNFAASRRDSNRRRFSRVSVKLWGYIVDGGREDSVPILDMSRDGIRFRSMVTYQPDQIIQIAVAYMAGTANIFVPGKIVWRKGEENSEYEYGLRFMSRSPIM